MYSILYNNIRQVIHIHSNNMIGIGWATLYTAIIESYQKKSNLKTESQPQSQPQSQSTL